MTLAEHIEQPFKSVLAGTVRLYQITLAPILPPACRFYPSCSAYAIETLRRKRLLTALGMIIWRLLRCNPFCKGGYDPVDADERRVMDKSL
ncbi:MAG: membrane protein insertion efficiency factor YidD [bacterium]